MKIGVSGPLALPLWIDGRPYLSMGEGLFDVCHPRTGEVVRRVPLCNGAEVDAAVGAARRSVASWAALAPMTRRRHLVALAESLSGYTSHFAELLIEECGMTTELAGNEVRAAVLALHGDALSIYGSHVVAVAVDDRRPLSSLAAMIAPALLAGAAVVCKPSPRAPGAAFALCELGARAGLPAGVCNLVHGDLAALEALCSHGDVGAIGWHGDAVVGAAVRELASRGGKHFVAGPSF